MEILHNVPSDFCGPGLESSHCRLSLASLILDHGSSPYGIDPLRADRLKVPSQVYTQESRLTRDLDRGIRISAGFIIVCDMQRTHLRSVQVKRLSLA